MKKEQCPIPALQQLSIDFEMNSRTYQPDPPLTNLNPNINPNINLNEHSQNFYLDLNNDANSRSRFNNILKEDSINIRAFFGGEYSRYIGQEDMENLEGGNTINFWELARQNLFQPGSTSTDAAQGTMVNSRNQQEQQMGELDHNKRKGLKYLAWIMNRLLRKQKYDTNEIVNACISYVLPHPSPTHTQQQKLVLHKEAQNIRRRIYDAINVMTAVGLVLRTSQSEIYIKSGSGAGERVVDWSANEVGFSKRKEQEKSKDIDRDELDPLQNYRKTIQQKNQNIRTKQQYLNSMKAKIKKLQQLTTRNKATTTTTNTTTTSATTKPINSQQTIKFPFLVLNTKNQQQLTIVCYGKNRRQVKIKYKDEKNMFIMAQLDCLQSMPDLGKVKMEPKAKKQVKKEMIMEGQQEDEEDQGEKDESHGLGQFGINFLEFQARPTPYCKLQHNRILKKQQEKVTQILDPKLTSTPQQKLKNQQKRSFILLNQPSRFQ